MGRYQQEQCVAEICATEADALERATTVTLVRIRGIVTSYHSVMDQGLGEDAAAKQAMREIKKLLNMHRFPAVFCSQCGGKFGPGDHGFSTCDSHKGA